ncbi:MAG TPA: molecular chaperone DnaJ [Gemmatimonadaceae bacterium]|jgi:molecular chaperone DnaJ|nr:molecular chaperone DnaJ [Gemmatimonadaceae bacterium]
MADFYQTLGVTRNASDAEIKTAYRKLAMTYHPDRNNGSKDAEEKFKEITEAYDVLRDPDKRAMYDRYGEAGLRGGAGFHHVDLSEALSIFMRDLGGLGGFGDLFGGGMSRGSGPRTGSDIKIAMPMTLLEVATGAEKKVTVRLLEPCDRCEGRGAEPGSSPVTCTTCRGSGEVRRAQRSFFGQVVSVAPCPTCSGEGTVISSPCKKCRGEGRVRGEKEILVRIPAGVATGQYMTMRGVGNVGPRGGPRGDILVVFEVEEDSRFERDGEDLYTEVLVTYPQLALGSNVEVPMVTGTVSLQVPAGTQSGQVFNLRGRGLPRINSSSAGDLHVRLQLWTPDNLSEEELALINQLGELQKVPPARPKGLWSKLKESLGA